MSIGVPSWVAGYSGIPFVERGFEVSGCHCWGLVCLVYKTQAEIELPTYAEISAGELFAIAREMRTSSAGDPWSPVKDARHDLDVALMSGQVEPGKLVALHVGLIAGGTHILHVEKQTAAVCVRLTHPTVKHRILGTYRHRDLQ